MCISQYLNSDERPFVHKRSNTIASAAGADYSRFIVPADTEVLEKLGARSF